MPIHIGPSPMTICIMVTVGFGTTISLSSTRYTSMREVLLQLLTIGICIHLIYNIFHGLLLFDSFKSFPRWSKLHHFNDGVMKLSFNDGSKHHDISKVGIFCEAKNKKLILLAISICCTRYNKSAWQYCRIYPAQSHPQIPQYDHVCQSRCSNNRYNRSRTCCCEIILWFSLSM